MGKQVIFMVFALVFVVGSIFVTLSQRQHRAIDDVVEHTSMTKARHIANTLAHRGLNGLRAHLLDHANNVPAFESENSEDNPIRDIFDIQGSEAFYTVTWDPATDLFIINSVGIVPSNGGAYRARTEVHFMPTNVSESLLPPESPIFQPAINRGHSLIFFPDRIEVHEMQSAMTGDGTYKTGMGDLDNNARQSPPPCPMPRPPGCTGMARCPVHHIIPISPEQDIVIEIPHIFSIQGTFNSNVTIIGTGTGIDIGGDIIVAEGKTVNIIALGHFRPNGQEVPGQIAFQGANRYPGNRVRVDAHIFSRHRDIYHGNPRLTNITYTNSNPLSGLNSALTNQSREALANIPRTQTDPSDPDNPPDEDDTVPTLPERILGIAQWIEHVVER